MNSKITYKTLTSSDFEACIALGTQVHGDGYIDIHSIKEWLEKGIKNTINSSFVAYKGKKLVGFRITFSALQWQIDQWCSTKLWRIAPSKVCYFKCSSVDESYRGYGIGSQLLFLSIEAVKKQGAQAGVSHLWMESPGNSAVKYFSKSGGVLIKEHRDRWLESSLNGYKCTICDSKCHCTAAEMIIYFS
ncbi:GNAT family N-acetyltransferase [Colwelliaceae bacterium 6441]